MCCTILNRRQNPLQNCRRIRIEHLFMQNEEKKLVFEFRIYTTTLRIHCVDRGADSTD